MPQVPPDSHHASILRRWARRLLPLAVVLAVVWLIVQQRQGSGGHLEGEGLPEATLELSDGSEVRLGEPLGEVVVLNFWATWCAPCRTEAPELSEMHREMRERGRGRVVGVSVEQAPLSQAAQAAKRLGMRYPIGVATPELLGGLDVQLLPTTLVLDADGTVHRSFVGAVTAHQLRRALP
ncbi:MAG: TlpA family protein disulfide reductase [Myxococcota bacterium]